MIVEVAPGGPAVLEPLDRASPLPASSGCAMDVEPSAAPEGFNKSVMEMGWGPEAG